jgi:hypothetical protein
MRLALLQIGLNALGEIGTAVDTGHYIVEIDSPRCRTQTPLRLLHRPDGEWSKRTYLLSDFGYMCDELLFISNRCQETTLQSVVSTVAKFVEQTWTQRSRRPSPFSLPSVPSVF